MSNAEQNLIGDMKEKGYEPIDAPVYGNAGHGMALVFHRSTFIRTLAIELDEIMNRHNAYARGWGDKLFVVFK